MPGGAARRRGAAAGQSPPHRGPGSSSAAAFAPDLEALRQGLRELGYVEGRNLTLEVRWAEGRPERLADLVAELVRLPVDLIVTHSNPGVLAAKHATTTLPIVVVGMGMDDPVDKEIVESLAHPGGNITGWVVSLWEPEAKCLELLKEAFPGVTRVGVRLSKGGGSGDDITT